MAKFTIKIESILGGQAATKYFPGPGQFETSIAIDPDFPADGGSFMIKAGGVITPVAYADFSGGQHSDTAMWIITNPKDAKVYTYLRDGKFNSYSSIFGSEANVGTPTSGAGNGGAYYNNYIYLFTPTNVSRYGPLNNSPQLANSVWTGATLGSQTALTNTSYPVAGGVNYPNHVAHYHPANNRLYFCDFKNGQGFIHYIETTKVTDEGDTDNGSKYNALDLPFGFKPTAITSYGNDLIIAAIQTSDTELRQGSSALFFWDTENNAYYRQIDIPTPLVTALLNDNGEILIWSGNRNNGYMVSRYTGGFRLQRLYFSEEGQSPFAGAVDAYGNRVVWGHSTTYPETSACVLSMGYKHPSLPQDAIHNIIRTASTGTLPVITALEFAQQPSGISPRLIVAWNDGSGEGIDKLAGAGTQKSIIRLGVQNIGQPFQLTKIRIPLSGPVAASQIITPKILIDDESSTDTLTVINNTNYTKSERNIVYRGSNLKGVEGEHNFQLQLEFTGTDVISVLFPIIIEGETKGD